MRISFASQLGRGGAAPDPILAQGSNWAFVVSPYAAYNDLWQTDTFGTAATADNDVVGSSEDNFGSWQFTGVDITGTLFAPTLDIVGGIRSLDFGASDGPALRTGTNKTTAANADLSAQSAVTVFFACDYNSYGTANIVEFSANAAANNNAFVISTLSTGRVYVLCRGTGNVEAQFTLPVSNGERFYGAVTLGIAASGNANIIKCEVNGSPLTAVASTGTSTGGSVFGSAYEMWVGRRGATNSRGLRSKLQFCGVLKGAADSGTLSGVGGKLAEISGVTP